MPGANKEERIVTDLLALADVKLNGDRPWDVQVHDPSVFGRVLSEGSLGLGETYMEGLWDVAALDQFIYRIHRADLAAKIKPNLQLTLYFLKNRLLNLQKKKNAFSLKHYDTGNELFIKMLDRRMVYTCGYWAAAQTLDAAQEAKLDLVCRKIGLKPGMKVLDIGCGWGSFMKYAAEKYGVSCVGVTISQAQMELGQKLCGELPIEFRLQDYRDITGTYDAVVSLGMFEHVGFKNYETFMNVVQKSLKDDGLFLLHTIGVDNSSPQGASDPWLNKYIFTQGILPSLSQLARAIEDVFIMEDWHNFGADYDKTLMAWYGNFETNWDSIKKDYSPEFFRMWKYYLLACAGGFRARKISLWQLVLSKNGIPGGHKPVR